ncbi:MAG TPA: tetratricopeptide repeat protein [Gemmatimonadaceae bacterium]|nr:tetratricopeptide repeat protein [Gemmatimonadaceae bacterium]
MHHFAKKRGAWVVCALVIAGGSLVAGCDTNKLVSVTDPTLLTPGDVASAGAVPGLVQGAYAQLVGGYSGFGDDAFLSSSAVITDETYYGDTFTTRQAADSRNLQPTALGNISDAAFSRLQSARFNARRAFAAVAKYSTASTAAADKKTQAKLRAIEGYTYVTLSEGWCGAVPFSVVPDTGSVDPSKIVPGTPLTTMQMNDTAIVRFTEALALDPNNSLAKIGMARALLNEARFAEAAAAVSSVADTYAFLLEHSTNSGGENNPMASLMQNGRYGVANLEGGLNGTAALRPDNNTLMTAPSAEGLNFRTANDPRVPYKALPNCFTSSIRCWLNENYPDFNADVPMASGVEARLIQAEAALQAGDAAGMMTILNNLRRQSTNLLTKLYPGQVQVFFDNGAIRTLPDLSDPADPNTSAATQFAARRDLLFRERAFWLYNTGHRQGDLRRLARAPYSLPTNAVFPSGPFFRGGLTFGNDVAYPVPFNEQNNPNFKAESCSTTTA